MAFMKIIKWNEQERKNAEMGFYFYENEMNNE